MGIGIETARGHVIKKPAIQKYITLGILFLFAGGLLYFVACAPAPTKRKPGKFVRKQCLDCHTEFAAKYLSMPDVHAPVKEIKCEDCHLRHGIVPKLLLKREGNQTCFKCHDSQKIGMEKAVVHTALKKNQCISCHNPHASQTKPLLTAPGRQLCYLCHQQQTFEKKVV